MKRKKNALRLSVEWGERQVGFHDEKAVKKTKVAKRLNEVVNRLNRTKQEHYPDLEKERETWDKQVCVAGFVQSQ